jgi:hypothetical protein
MPGEKVSVMDIDSVPLLPRSWTPIRRLGEDDEKVSDMEIPCNDIAEATPTQKK